MRGRHLRRTPRSTVLRRAVTTGLVLGGATLALLPVAQADETTSATVVPAVEAWYQADPTCALPVSCVGGTTAPAPPVAPPAPAPGAPTSPYPSGTLHVAVDGGKETARSYLSFRLPAVPVQLLGAHLDVPLDAAAGDGSVSPEAAKVAVCAFAGPLQEVDGSFAAPPAVSCANAVSMTYSATPAPHLSADLGALLPQLAQGDGLALVPDAARTTQTDAWHVVFSAHARSDSAKTPPASLSVVLAPVGAQPPEQAVEVPAAPGVLLALPPVAAAPFSASGVAVGPTVPAAAGASSVAALPAPRTIRVGYAYPAVWLLPLAFLLGIPLVARALTRDLTPRQERSGR